MLAGRDITRLSASARARRGLRRTFQRVQTFGWLSVEDNVLAALEWRGGGGGFVADLVYSPTRRRRERDRRARVEEVLDRCGLLPVRKELAGSLPIGVARMVEFARAVVDPPQLLLLDEPASGLDETEIARLGGRDPGGAGRVGLRGAAGGAQRGLRHGAERPGGGAQPGPGARRRAPRPTSSATRRCATRTWVSRTPAPTRTRPDAAEHPDATTPDATGDGAAEPA